LNKRRREFYKLNRDKCIAKVVRWQKNNKDKIKKYRLEHRETTIEGRKEYYKKNPDKKKEMRFRMKLSRLGVKMSYDEYNKMFEKQKHLCAICGERELKRLLSIDHDHKTNKVRGLLCGKCNQGLGLFRDNVELLKKAIKYLLK